MNRMKRMKIVGLCLLAAFAIAAVAAVSASAAEPEWGRCIATKKGNYTNSNCTTKSSKPHKGSYEWYTGAAAICYPKKGGEYDNSSCTSKSGKPHKGKYEKTAGPGFKGVGGKSKLWAGVRFQCNAKGVAHDDRQPCNEPGDEIAEYIAEGVECASEAASGEAADTNGLANVKVTFRECTLFETVPCTSAGAAHVGEVNVNTLKGELGYINKAKKEVGVLLRPASGTVFATFRCFSEEEGANAEFVVGVGNATEGAYFQPESTGGNDGIISPITPIDTMTNTFTQEYTVAERNHHSETYAYNLPQKFESGPVTDLETYFEGGEAYEKGENAESTMWSSAGEEVTNVSTPEGASEIKA